MGSIQEDDSQQGLAHFLEHMAFNGSEHFPEGKMLEYLQTIGVEFGRSLNAYTSIDRTVYYIADVSTERQVLRNIVQRRPNKTCIITTHRPTVLSMCQRVYRVLDRQVTELNEEESSRMAQDF